MADRFSGVFVPDPGYRSGFKEFISGIIHAALLGQSYGAVHSDRPGSCRGLPYKRTALQSLPLLLMQPAVTFSYPAVKNHPDTLLGMAALISHATTDGGPMLWKIVPNLREIDARLREIGAAGYSLVVNVRGLTPEYYLSTFPEHWLSLYAERQYAVFDPVSIWARLNSGRIRWSEIRPAGLTPVQEFILNRGADYGLVYGGGASRSEPERPGTFSFLFCARSDRELLDEELDVIEESLDVILSAVSEQPGFGDQDLRILSELARGSSQKEIAAALTLSRETIKKRIEKIRIQLGARNSTHAVSLAQRKGLILTLPDRMPYPEEGPED